MIKMFRRHGFSVPRPDDRPEPVYQKAIQELSASVDRVSERLSPHDDAADTRRLSQTNEIAIAALEARVVELRTAVAVAIEHEDRREKRIRASISRSRKELAERGLEDPALEAEYDGLSVVDGGGGAEEGMHPVPEEVAGGAETEASSIPGVSMEALRKVRGI